MLHRFYLYTALAVAAVSTAAAQSPATSGQTLTLEQCREMALQNNKQMSIKSEQVRQAGYQRKEAFAAYLPSIDFAGGYTYNQKNISLFDSDQMLPIKSFDMKKMSYEFNLVTNPETGAPIKGHDGQYIP